MKLTQAIGAILAFSASTGAAYQSSHMKEFRISQCTLDSEKCFEASGDVAFLSMTQKLMVASNVKLAFQSGDSGMPAKTQSCATFRFEFTNQILTCDNSSLPGGKLLTLDADFKNANLKNSSVDTLIARISQ